MHGDRRGDGVAPVYERPSEIVWPRPEVLGVADADAGGKMFLQILAWPPRARRGRVWAGGLMVGGLEVRCGWAGLMALLSVYGRNRSGGINTALGN